MVGRFYGFALIMGILSALWDLIAKIFDSIFSWLGDLLGDWFLVILIIVAIWFAPVIATWLTSVGAPGFLVSAFQTLAVATPWVQSAGAWLWKGGASLLSSAWSGFKALDVGTQAAIVLGAAAAIAPEETEQLLTEAVDLATDIVTNTGGAVLGALSKSPAAWIIGGIAAWFLFFHDKDNKGVETRPAVGAQNG